MSTPFLGEIKIVAFNYPPKGWAFCNGQLLAINQNQALFSILGTTYGGNGTQNFALPNLQGRVALHIGNGFVEGQLAGESNVTLNSAQIPSHNHPLLGTSNTASSVSPAGNTLADVRGATGVEQYQAGPDTLMSPTAVAPAGGGQPHNNLQPYLVVNFCIALQGIFPSRNAPATGAGRAQ